MICVFIPILQSKSRWKLFVKSLFKQIIITQTFVLVIWYWRTHISELWLRFELKNNNSTLGGVGYLEIP